MYIYIYREKIEFLYVAKFKIGRKTRCILFSQAESRKKDFVENILTCVNFLVFISFNNVEICQNRFPHKLNLKKKKKISF